MPRSVRDTRFSAFAVLLAALGAMGCSARSGPEPTPPRAGAQEEIPAQLAASTGPRRVHESPRRVGDVLVHRYSGSYRGQALVLVEEVVDATSELLIVDYRVVEGAEPVHLRVHLTLASERVLEVHRVVDGEVEPSSIGEYEALLALTSLTPDANRGLIGRRTETCLLGESEDTCQVSEFEVDVAGKPARLAVERSTRFSRDIAGEIVALDGTVLYRADLIEAKRGAVPVNHETTASLSAVPSWAH